MIDPAAPKFGRASVEYIGFVTGYDADTNTFIIRGGIHVNILNGVFLNPEMKAALNALVILMPRGYAAGVWYPREAIGVAGNVVTDVSQLISRFVMPPDPGDQPPDPRGGARANAGRAPTPNLGGRPKAPKPLGRPKKALKPGRKPGSKPPGPKPGPSKLGRPALPRRRGPKPQPRRRGRPPHQPE